MPAFALRCRTLMQKCNDGVTEGKGPSSDTCVLRFGVVGAEMLLLRYG